MQELIDKWKERLKQFKKTPMPKNMDPSVSMGVEHGRSVTLEVCIKELEDAVRRGNGAVV